MTTEQLIREFGNKFGFSGKLDNRINLTDVSVWLNDVFIAKQPAIDALKQIRSITEDGMMYDSKKLDEIHEISDTIIFENGNW